MVRMSAALAASWRGKRLEAVLHGQIVVGRSRPLCHDHPATAVAEVLGMGVSLRAVAQNGDRLPFQQGQIGVLIVVNLWQA